MIFREIIERLTGVSCPIFGVSWNPSETERTKAIKIMILIQQSILPIDFKDNNFTFTK